MERLSCVSCGAHRSSDALCCLVCGGVIAIVVEPNDADRRWAIGANARLRELRGESLIESNVSLLAAAIERAHALTADEVFLP